MSTEKHFLRRSITENSENGDVSSTHNHALDGVPHHWTPAVGHNGNQVYHFNVTAHGEKKDTPASFGEVSARNDEHAVAAVHRHMAKWDHNPDTHHVTVSHVAAYHDENGDRQFANRARQVYHKDAIKAEPSAAKPAPTYVGHTPDDFHKVLSDHGYSKASEHKGVALYKHSNPHHPEQMVHTKVDHFKNTASTHGSYGMDAHKLKSHLDAVHSKPTFHDVAHNIIHGVKEEAEPIKEVSKKYLAKYLRKASWNVEDNAFKAGETINHDEKSAETAHKKVQKRQDGIGRAISKITKEEVELEEGLKLLQTHGTGKKTAKVYKDSEWNEFRVKHFTDGVHHKDADYHTDDKDDAHDTAKHFVKEEASLDEGKTFRRDADGRKSSNLTNALKKYSAGKKAAAGEKRRIDELFGFFKKEGRLPVNQRIEPTFDKAKPKSPISGRIEPDLSDTIPKKRNVKPRAAIAKTAPAVKADTKPAAKPVAKTAPAVKADTKPAAPAVKPAAVRKRVPKIIKKVAAAAVVSASKS